MASNIITVNQDIIQKTIEIRKKFRLKLPDAVIAATALVYDYTLISDNDKDFVKVSGLKYINPMKMDWVNALQVLFAKQARTGSY